MLSLSESGFEADCGCCGVLVSKDASIILACSRGGLIHKSKHYPKGIASRSFIAAAILIKAGFTNVAHVNGGTGSGPRYQFQELAPVARFILVVWLVQSPCVLAEEQT